MWTHVSLVMIPTRHVGHAQNVSQVACEALGPSGSLYLGRYIPHGDGGLVGGFEFLVPRLYVFPEHSSLVTSSVALAKGA